MKLISLILFLCPFLTSFSQNHSQKPIRFIFESIHDHLGNLDVNSKRVQLFNMDHQLLYEADLYDGKELDEQFFYYNEEGELIRDHRIFHKTHESGDYRFTLDDKGNVIEEINMNDIEEVLERKTMTYDGHKIKTQKVEFFHHEGNKMVTESYFEFTYDSDGIRESKTGWENGKPNQKVTYKYSGTMFSRTTSKFNAANELVEKWVVKFGKKEERIQEVHSRFNKGRAMTKTIDITYDDHGNVLTETMSKSGSSVKKVITFEYVYDEFGNWIERKEHMAMGAKKSEGAHLIRHIEYYDKSDYNHPPMEMDETYGYETHDGNDYKVFQESHVRINNNNGDLEWVVRRNGQALYQVDEFEYKDGKLDRIIHLTHEHKDHAYTQISYNEKGQLIQEVSYGHDDQMEEKIVYAYNSKGWLDSKTESAGTKVLLSEKYHYSPDGKVFKMSVADAGANYEVEYAYSPAGELIKEVQTPNDKEGETLKYEYTYKNGSLMSRLKYSGKSKTPSRENIYEYDGAGELVKMKTRKGEKVILEVDYTYFE